MEGILDLGVGEGDIKPLKGKRSLGVKTVKVEAPIGFANAAQVVIERM